MSWQLLPNVPEKFIFTNINLAGLPKTRVGILPCPEQVTNANNVFINYSWDVFYNIGLLIKKILKGKYPEGIRGDREVLFSFEYKPSRKSQKSPGKFILTFEQEWVAKILCSRKEKRVKASTNCPWKALGKIMPRLQRRLQQIERLKPKRIKKN